MNDGQVKARALLSLSVSQIHSGREAKGATENERMAAQASTITAYAHEEKKDGQAQSHCP